MNKVDRLTQVVERNAEWREAERQKAELAAAELARYRETELAPNKKRIDFWCGNCRLDFNALGIKSECGGGRSVYGTYCPKCNYRCLRRITDKARDPYFNESDEIRKARSSAGDDLLQPGDPRWDKVYGKKIRDRESYDKEGLERVQWERNRGKI